MVSLEEQYMTNSDKAAALIVELGPKWVAHAANQAVFKPAELSILERFALERINERKAG
jgi:hypothetical protein